MKSILFLFACLFVGLYAQEDTCIPLTCLSPGDTCALGGPQSNISLEVCQFDFFCDVESGTVGTGQCTDRPTLGESCSIPLDSCQQLTFQSVVCTADDINGNVNATEGICELGVGQARINDGCLSDEQCGFTGLSSCVDGICQGVVADGACNSTNDCIFGHYCSVDAICVPQQEEGQQCIGLNLPGSLESEVCILGLTCGLNGTCVPFFSVDDGEACFSNDECHVGSFCRLSNITFDLAQFGLSRPVSGICQRYPTELIQCDTVDDCTEFGDTDRVICDCDRFTTNRVCILSQRSTFPILFEPFSSDIFQSIISCYQQNNCSLFSSAPDSCAQTHCPQELSCLLAAIEVFGPINQRIIDQGCRIAPNFTCQAFLPPPEVICSDDQCCHSLATPNLETGQGFLQFNPDCLQGGENCLRQTGCELCFNATIGGDNLENRPVCRNVTEVTPTSPTEELCFDQECCSLRSNPNLQTGQGYLQFDSRCFEGGIHCVDTTGCALCFAESSGAVNVGDRPVCPQSVVDSINEMLGGVGQPMRREVQQQSITLVLNDSPALGVMVSTIIASIIYLLA